MARGCQCGRFFHILCFPVGGGKVFRSSPVDGLGCAGLPVSEDKGTAGECRNIESAMASLLHRRLVSVRPVLSL